MGALGWAVGNQAGREAGSVNMLAYVVWAALFSVPPLLALSLLLEGPAAIAAGLARATPLTWAAVLWQSVGNTMFGYACWAWLLARYPAATVAPMSLLVPVFGFGASAIVLHEPLPPWKIIATLLIMGGLAVNLFWVRRGQPKADETVLRTVSSDERRELGRAAEGRGKSEIGGEPV
jgi:O-acetylserine/cysteine efflux transporter